VIEAEEDDDDFEINNPPVTKNATTSTPAPMRTNNFSRGFRDSLI
jgi:hypothetical protein